MSVKSTVDITRAEAERRYTQHILKKVTIDISFISDRVLEDLLERANDDDAGGEGFENYTIVGGK